MGSSKEAPLSAVFGPGAHYEGDLSYEGRVRVDGHFSGRIYSEDALEVGADGVIVGEVDVASAVIAGRVVGRLRVREHLLLQPGSMVSGKLDAGIVDLRPGACIDARVRIDGKELP